MFKFIFLFLLLGFLEVNAVVILQYHRFGNAKYASTNTSTELFAKQLAYLKAHHFHMMSLSDVVDALQHHKALPRKTAVITIDDAYISVYKNAYPLLKKYNFPSTIFVNSSPIIHHSKSFMSLIQMKEMGKNGAEFANHTHTHQYLARYDDAVLDKKVTKEILTCEHFLTKHLQPYLSKYKMLAYPFGEYDKRVIKIMKKLGYIGVAQNSAPIDENSDFMALTRFPMANRFGGMKSFPLKVNTQTMPIQEVDIYDTMLDEKNNPPKMTITLKKPLHGVHCFTADGEPIVFTKITNTRFSIEAKKPLTYPRNHYTCTAMAKNGTWFWYSKMWVISKD